MFRKLLLSAAVLALSANAASAATVLNWGSADAGTAYTLDFNGFIGSPGTPTVIPGLTAEIKYTLNSVSADKKSWVFGYDIANTSSAPTTGSRISSFGFSTSSMLTSGASTGTYGFADTTPGNIPNNIPDVDICFKAVSNGQCAGNGGGLGFGGSGSGTITLGFGSAVSSLDLSDFYVRYQSVAPSTISGSASGVPTITSGVPEPTTWALMITGFGLAGAALRRRRTLVAA